MDQPQLVHQLLEHVVRGSEGSSNVLAWMSAVPRVDAQEGDAWSCSLTEAAKDGKAKEAMVVLGFVNLANVSLALKIMDAGVVDNLVMYATDEDAKCAFAHMLSEGSSYAAMRTKLAASASVQKWLNEHEAVASEPVRIALDLVRIKLAIQTDKTQGDALQLPEETCHLMWTTMCTYLNTHDVCEKGAALKLDIKTAAYGDALEAMYYLVSLPALRVALSEQTETLRTLGHILSAPMKKGVFSVRSGEPNQMSVYESKDASMPVTSSHAYVVVSILAIMTAYLPQLSAKDRQILALRQSALRKSGKDSGTDVRLEPPAVERRIHALVDAGLLPSLVKLAMQAMPAQLSRTLQSLFLSLVTEQNPRFRGRLIQLGISRALLAQAQSVYATATKQTESITPDDLVPLQALAKLSISTDPALLFGLDGASAYAAKYLAVLFLAPTSTLLQVFEAALALTNVASMSPAMATLVGNATYAPSELRSVSEAIVPLFLQHESVMLRRALIELLCNLVQDDAIFAHWSGESDSNEKEDDDDPTLRLHTSYGRIRFLFTLVTIPADEQDMALAKAVTGLLATLASSPSTCERIVRMPPDSVRILANLLVAPLAPLDACELALRVLTLVSSLIEYIAWLGTSSRKEEVRKFLGASDLASAVERYVQMVVASAHKSGDTTLAPILGLQKQTLEMGLQILQALKS